MAKSFAVPCRQLGQFRKQQIRGTCAAAVPVAQSLARVRSAELHEGVGHLWCSAW